MQTHDTTRPNPNPSPTLRHGALGLVDVASFGIELAMLALLAVTGARLGTGALGVGLAILLPLAAGSIWSVWMAPRGSRRLEDPARFGAQVALFIVTGLLAALAGMAALGIAFGVVATVPFALTRVRKA